MSAFAVRQVRPELIDTLAPEAPAALASRRDLRRINVIMLHSRIVAGLLKAHIKDPPRRILDLGCGDGHATLALARAMAPHWGRPMLTLVDTQPSISLDVLARFAALGWTVDVVSADASAYRGPPCDLALANLFLHHFEPPALKRLLATIAGQSRDFVATEPLRTAFAHLASRCVGAIGANAVTRHDAPASVRAGFRGGELSALWPGRVRFEGARGPLTHAFVGSAQG